MPPKKTDSPNRATRRKLSAVRAQYADAVGGELVEFELDDGSVFTFPHPLFVDDDWQAGFQAVEGNAGNVKYLLGDEQYAKFKAAGGRDVDVMLLLGDVQRDTAGVLSDGTPTRSSTS